MVIEERILLSKYSWWSSPCRYRHVITFSLYTVWYWPHLPTFTGDQISALSSSSSSSGPVQLIPIIQSSSTRVSTPQMIVRTVLLKRMHYCSVIIWYMRDTISPILRYSRVMQSWAPPLEMTAILASSRHEEHGAKLFQNGRTIVLLAQHSTDF